LPRSKPNSPQRDRHDTNNGARPKIGITTSPRREADYYLTYGRAVEAAGADAVYLPPGTSSVDDRLFNAARQREIPVLGLCRGQQVINVAMGGSLIQHLEGHEVRAYGRKHLAHTVEVDPASELGRAAEGQPIRVNSLHHQAVRSVASGLRQTATGDDGTIEGLESDDGLIVAVQCHPEELTGDLPWASKLFERFVARARARR